jgi:hypothetical protein
MIDPKDTTSPARNNPLIDSRYAAVSPPWTGFRLTLLDQVAGLGETGNGNVAKDAHDLGRAVDVADVLHELCRDLSVPDRGRDGDSDGGPDARPEIQNRGGYRHVLMSDGSLDANVRRNDGRGAAQTVQDLRSDERPGRGGKGGPVDETEATGR